jgi:hypothetical protein
MTETVRWELEISKETDRNMRRYLRTENGDRPCFLSAF